MTSKELKTVDCISRQDAIDCFTCTDPAGTFMCCSSAIERLEALPSVQPGLQVGDDCISRAELYNKIAEREESVRSQLLGMLNGGTALDAFDHVQRLAQLSEITALKHLVADAGSV